MLQDLDKNILNEIQKEIGDQTISYIQNEIFNKNENTIIINYFMDNNFYHFTKNEFDIFLNLVKNSTFKNKDNNSFKLSDSEIEFIDNFNINIILSFNKI